MIVPTLINLKIRPDKDSPTIWVNPSLIASVEKCDYKNHLNSEAGVLYKIQFSIPIKVGDVDTTVLWNRYKSDQDFILQWKQIFGFNLNDYRGYTDDNQ